MSLRLWIWGAEIWHDHTMSRSLLPPLIHSHSKKKTKLKQIKLNQISYGSRLDAAVQGTCKGKHHDCLLKTNWHKPTFMLRLKKKAIFMLIRGRCHRVKSLRDISKRVTAFNTRLIPNHENLRRLIHELNIKLLRWRWSSNESLFRRFTK